LRPLTNNKKFPGSARPKNSNLPPLGIDLIEIKKAKSFYAANQRYLGSFFSDREIRYIRGGKRPYVKLAVLLAAKEAVFKAMRKDWMGTEGFRKINIVPAGCKNFTFRLKGDFSEIFLNEAKLKGSFSENKDYVVARLSVALGLDRKI